MHARLTRAAEGLRLMMNKKGAMSFQYVRRPGYESICWAALI
jgi:hypothetical protein